MGMAGTPRLTSEVPRHPPHFGRRARAPKGPERKTVMATPHTGEKAPVSGIYKPANGGKEITVSQGDTLPPAKGKATGYKLVRPTR